MRRIALAVLGALALGGLAHADDEDARWNKLAAQGARYNADEWVRLEAPDGRFAWVDAVSARKLTAHRGHPRRVVGLWTDSMPHIAHVGDGVRYVVSDDTYDCRKVGLWTHRWFFGADGRLMAERIPEEGELSETDLLFQVVCKGAPVKAGARIRTIAAVLAVEPDLGAEDAQ